CGASLIVRVSAHTLAVRQLQGEIAARNQRGAQVSAAMVEAARWEVTVGPGARVVSLHPRHGGAGGRATVFFDPKSRRTLITGSQLAYAAGGRFVAWATGEGESVPLGVLALDRSGNASM